MSGITTGVGLVSGINSAQLIEQLLALEGRGKIPIQRRLAAIQQSKTALLDVNARLLNLKNAASSLRIGKTFQTMSAASGDESVLTATASSLTPPGTYNFTVGRLVSTSQLLSRGFATKSSSPLGLDSMSFEWGDASLEHEVALAELRGGAGVTRGAIKFTDALARTATVDLSTAITLSDVVDQINAAEGLDVTASIENERIVVRDTSGGGGSLKVEDVGSGSIAADLGIAGTFLSGSVTGSQINQIGVNTGLATLNDGTGVFIRDGVADFRLRVNGTTYDISLGREDEPITSSTKLSDLNNGSGVRINTTDADDFTVVTSTGVSVGVNLGPTVVDGEVQDPAVSTVGEMLARVNAELDASLGAGSVVMTLDTDGTRFLLTDRLGGPASPKVIAAGPNSDRTAKDLGIYTGATDVGSNVITGTLIRNKVATPRAATLQDVIDRIKSQTANNVTATVNASGTGLALAVATGSTIEVLAGTTDGSSFGAAVGERTARDLGLLGLSGTTSVTGTRVAAGVGTVRTSSLRGGSGLGGPTSITITDQSGAAFTFTDFAAHDTVDSLLRGINAAATAAGVDVALAVSDSGRSLVARDSSGGTGSMTFAGDGAGALGLPGSSTTSIARGSDLERRHLTLGSTLAGLNFGKGIGIGTFRITDSAGTSAVVDVGNDAVTVYDVISEINSRGLLVEARINADGDGITLVDTNSGTPINSMKVADVTGSVARGLGISGTAAAAGDDIAGSFEKTVDLDVTDTLEDVVGKINAAKLSVSASIVNAGSGTTPFRLNLASTVGGARGQLWVEGSGTDLGFVETSQGRDASLFLGTGNPATSFLFTSSTNTFKDIVSGLEVTAKKAGSSTQVEVTRDSARVVNDVKQLVTTMNDALGRIADYDKYDQETEKKGALLGNPTVARVRQQLIQATQGAAKGVEGRYRYLSQVGIRFGKAGKLEFDEAKFNAAYALDPAAVEELFTAFEVGSTTTSSPIEGVTVEGNATTTYTKLGFSDVFDQLLKKLTNSVDGVVTLADRSFQEQIDGLQGRLERFDERLESRRLRFEAQFAAMEAALAKLQGQQSSLGAIAANMAIGLR
ncbi:MAG: Flagellar hook-associated protein 2 [Planctomycetota bacterium]|jgi:flagellar hook-associated protein 2